MSVLKRIWTWWHDLWEYDLYGAIEVDSHRWENKCEIRRRLAGRHNS